MCYMKEILKKSLKAALFTAGAMLFTNFFMGKFDKKIVGEIKKYKDAKPTFVKKYKKNQKIIKKATSGFPIFVFSIFLYGYGNVYHKKIAIIGKDLMLGFLIAGGISRFFKHFAGRARPRITHDTLFRPISLRKGFDSFPSGHTTVAVCFSSIMMGHFPWLSPVFWGYGALTAFDRLFGISHFPSDVLTGTIIGISVGQAITHDSRDIARVI